MRRTKIAGAMFMWVISFHGMDYGSIATLLENLPKKVAASAKIFECVTLDGGQGMCVAYDEPRYQQQEDEKGAR